MASPPLAGGNKIKLSVGEINQVGKKGKGMELGGKRDEGMVGKEINLVATFYTPAKNKTKFQKSNLSGCS